MKNKQTKFNTYIFLSTFARTLIETFIPVILFKNGFNLKEVIFYFFLYNIIEFFLSFILVKSAIKRSNRFIRIIGLLVFILVQVLLNMVNNSVFYLFLLALFFAIYRTGYWISRRYYNLKIIKKEHISKDYSIITIFNQLGKVFAGYIGSLFLDYIGTTTLTFIAIILYAISIIPLYYINDKKRPSKNIKLNLLRTLKKLGFSNIYLIGIYEVINVANFLFALYLFIYVKQTFQTVGLFNLITNLSVIAFALIYGKHIDGEKNYLKLSVLLVAIVYLFKVNVVGGYLVLICLFEGIALKMYEISLNKEVYSLSKKFEYNNYNLVYEIVCKSSRFIVLFIALFIHDLKVMIYVSIGFLLISLFVNVKTIKKEDFSYQN